MTELIAVTSCNGRTTIRGRNYACSRRSWVRRETVVAESGSFRPPRCRLWQPRSRSWRANRSRVHRHDRDAITAQHGDRPHGAVRLPDQIVVPVEVLLVDHDGSATAGDPGRDPRAV